MIYNHFTISLDDNTESRTLRMELTGTKWAKLNWNRVINELEMIYIYIKIVYNFTITKSRTLYSLIRGGQNKK